MSAIVIYMEPGFGQVAEHLMTDQNGLGVFRMTGLPVPLREAQRRAWEMNRHEMISAAHSLRLLTNSGPGVDSSVGPESNLEGDHGAAAMERHAAEGTSLPGTGKDTGAGTPLPTLPCPECSGSGAGGGRSEEGVNCTVCGGTGVLSNCLH